MNISLTPELEAMIHERVRTGLYHSASEVVRDALRLLQEREQLRAIRLEELRKEIDIADAEIERGEVAPLDMDAIIAKAKARKAGR
jgi:antitoxin ParD1/3/4